MRHRDPDDWTVIDKAMDRALAQLRSKKPDAETCATALKTLIVKLYSLDGEQQLN